MEFYVGMDVSLKETSICVVDGSGEIVSEGTVISEPANRSIDARDNSRAQASGR